MLIQAIIPGFLLGMIGSFHCVGMCGPLALSLPVHHLSKKQQVFAISWYNIGRVITYAVLGWLFGLAGRTIYLAGFQQWFSVSLGVAMLLITIQYFFGGNAFHPKWLKGFHALVQRVMIKTMQSRYRAIYMVLGMANGLLPCGMLYIAIAAALSATELLNSVLFMSFFGLGTLPAMFVLSFLGLKVGISTRQHIRKLMPYVAVAMAIILILRGLNLGIPFISPVLADRPAAGIICH